MAKCLSCNAECVGPTCRSCRAKALAGAPSHRGRIVPRTPATSRTDPPKTTSSTTPTGPVDHSQIKRWDSVLSASPVFAEHDAPTETAASIPTLDELPVLAPTVAPPTNHNWDALLSNSPVFAGQDSPEVLNPLVTAEIDCEVLTQVANWDAELSRSPVFAGMDDGQVVTGEAKTCVAGSFADELGVAIDVRFEYPSAPADTDPAMHMMLTLSPSGVPLMNGRDGPCAHIILCLDLSASMDTPDKYPLLAKALSEMFADLKSWWAHPVLVSVVAFAHGAETILSAVPSDQLDASSVLEALNDWQHRFTRYTDVGGALRLAARIAYDSVKACKAMPVRIYVLTDGKPQDMPRARAAMEKLAKLPVDVHALAFGDDADVVSMQQLLSGGRGATVKLVRADTIGDAFGRIGEVSQLVVANRALLDVELHGGVIGGGAYRSRPARYRYGAGVFARGVQFSTDLGTLESGRAYSLLFQLRMRRSKGSETEVGRICLRVPGFGGPRTFEMLVTIPRHPGKDLPERDAEVAAALDVVMGLDAGDPVATLKSLKIRRALYARERRDEHILSVLDKAIAEMEQKGNLTALTTAEHAALLSHTLTTRAQRQTRPGVRVSAAAAPVVEPEAVTEEAPGGPRSVASGVAAGGSADGDDQLAGR